MLKIGKSQISKAFSKFSAFTLAEVLITLGIIGVVAQATIPTLMIEKDKKALATEVQKFVSEFEAGMKQIMINNNCGDLMCTGIYGADNNPAVDNYTQELKAVFKDVEVCTSSCEHDFVLEKSISGHSLGWVASGSPTRPLYKIGKSIVRVYNVWSGTTDNKIKLVTAFWVDINGHKPPNTYGKDIHWIHISEYGSFYPDYGKDYCNIIYDGAYTSCTDYWKNNGTCNTDGSWSLGDGCLARIMENSWQFDFW